LQKLTLKQPNILQTTQYNRRSNRRYPSGKKIIVVDDEDRENERFLATESNTRDD
jgi:3,4-dihydroxy-2-butanone 4-phosphate synthase